MPTTSQNPLRLHSGARCVSAGNSVVTSRNSNADSRFAAIPTPTKPVSHETDGNWARSAMARLCKARVPCPVEQFQVDRGWSRSSFREAENTPQRPLPWQARAIGWLPKTRRCCSISDRRPPTLGRSELMSCREFSPWTWQVVVDVRSRLGLGASSEADCKAKHSTDTVMLSEAIALQTRRMTPAVSKSASRQHLPRTVVARPMSSLPQGRRPGEGRARAVPPQHSSEGFGQPSQQQWPGLNESAPGAFDVP